MSSTNFGPSEDARNSSRVLKPPGGGHTDIFGIYSDPNPKPTIKNNVPKSGIQAVFACDDTDKKTTIQEKTENIEKEEHKTENGKNGNLIENDAPKPIPATPQRVRVPPGGFSSGLW